MATILLTGGTSGIGQAAGAALSRGGHRVLVVARDLQRGRDTTAEWSTEPRVLACDLSDPDQVDAVAFDEPIDGVVHLAGILRMRAERGVGGADRVWTTNVLGPLRLVRRVLPRLPSGGTVSVVSGQAHQRVAVHPWSLGTSRGLRACVEVATAKVLWTRALARRRPDLVATTFCPGRVRSALHHGLPWPLSSVVGAAMAVTAVPAEVAAPHVVALALGEHPSGTYTVTGVPTAPASHTDDAELQDAVWDFVASWPQP